MLHETLLHLWNNPGGSDNESKLLELEEFLHPGEKKLLEEILEIVSKYHWIVAICKQIQTNTINSQPADSEIEPRQSTSTAELPSAVASGLYIKAFANGVHEGLADYRSEIVKLEESFLQNPQLPLVFIRSVLEKYRILFQVLKSMIQVVQKDNLHGCLLMGRLHKYSYCTVDIIANPADKITQAVNMIFYRHLCNWIIYGDLKDVHNEFFICDGKCHDENFLYPEQLETSSETNKSGIMLDLLKKSRIRRPPPVKKFFINWNMVPIFINEDTAESILFMGRIVWIVQNGPNKFSDEHYLTKCKRDVWDGKDIEYYKKVQALEKQTFNREEFQSVVEECRIKLTKYLWHVMLDEGNLKEHLRLIRDYYALGRGELFHQFIGVAEKHIQDTTCEYSTNNLNFIFLETARKIYGENDKTYMRFELTSAKAEMSSKTVVNVQGDSEIMPKIVLKMLWQILRLMKTKNSNPWSRVQLNFDISWPLHIVFHPKSMELYNKLFCFLLRLRKTHINLHKLWQLHMTRKQEIDRRVWALRQQLTFLVNNLEYYLQVDVIEAQFSLLLKAVENANEFEDIIKVHHEFISSLLAKTFVLTPDESHIYKNKHRLHQKPAVQFNVPSKVYNVIIRLLELCDKFCLIASTWGTELTEPEIRDLEEFQNRTNTVVETLLFILHSLHKKAKGQHLLQLLYQLDFSRYFSRNKPDFNLTVA